MIILEIFEEVWVPVKGFEGLYECSTEGRIRSLSRYVPKSGGKPACFIKGKVMKLSPNTNKYLVVTMSGTQKTKRTKLVNRLVFFSFNPDIKPLIGHGIDHIDDNRQNNKPNNLIQITNRKNSTKASKRKVKTSIYTGVCWNKAKNKWMASIKINNKNVYLGLFLTEREAAEAYQQKLSTINQ